MSVTIGLASSWQEAYATDAGFFARMQEWFTLCEWVMGRGTPPLRSELAAIYGWQMDDGDPCDWSALLAIHLPQPPHMTISPTDGLRAIHTACIALEQNVGGSEIPEVEGIDIVPMQASECGACEAVVRLDYEGRSRLVYSASWPIWSWSMLDSRVRQYHLDRIAQLDSLEQTSDPLDYEVVLILFCCQVLIHQLPVRITW